jgi:RNA polymerase sigma factor (sigma-70 family)
MEIDEHLFRRESGRLVATLTHIFGVHNLALAEDVAQDAFCRALEVWKLRGVPENPSAWLMATAKNRALDILRRERTAMTCAPELGRLLHTEWALAPIVQELFEPKSIQDDQLRMMFSCCHPKLPEEAQVALVLHILCGFSVDEIAGAFVNSHAAIEKRISRAKKTLAGSKNLFDVRDASDLLERLPAVQRAVYLLFNEGYHGASAEFAVRADLCREAMRLVGLLREHPVAATPSTHALGALMCLLAARLSSRTNASGNLVSLFDQDRSRWDQSLIAEGQKLLDLSASGRELTEYHLEAAIASLHSCAPDAPSTDWKGIVELYGLLFNIRPSPVIALNRAIAIAHLEGPERGLQEIRAIPDGDRLAEYPFYFAAVGELELRMGKYHIARKQFHRALTLARNSMERQFLERRLKASESRSISGSRAGTA